MTLTGATRLFATLLLTVGMAGPGLAAAPDRGAESPDLVTHRTQHFVLTTDCDGQTRRWIASRLEAFYDALEILVPAATGVAMSPDPIRVMLFENAEGFADHARDAAPGLGHNGGYYDGATRTVVAYHRSNPLQLQFHEISHAAMGDVFADPQYRRYARPGWPVWFDEGFAEYVSSYEVVEGALRFGAPHVARLATLLDALGSQQLPTLNQLLRARASVFSGEEMSVWYAAAWGLVDFLLAEPDLRTKVPGWVRRLRTGEDGIASFRTVFGPDLKALERRFHARVRQLAENSPGPKALLGGDTLDAWTVHESGSWRVEGGAIIGNAADRWSYVTRAVHPLDAWSFEVDLTRSEGVRVGLVIGHHAASGYPYHTLVDLDRGRLALRAITGPDAVQPIVERPVTGPGEPGTWSSLQLSMRHGVLSVWLDGRHVMATRVKRPTLSLLGLYVQGGEARFRRLALAPAPGYATGPAAATPPRPGPALLGR